MAKWLVYKVEGGIFHYSFSPNISGVGAYTPPPSNHGKYTIMEGGGGGYNFEGGLY